MAQAVQVSLMVLLSLFVSFMGEQQGIPTKKPPLCPAACHCKRNKRVQCVNKSLKTIPESIPRSTVFLDISENRNIGIPESFFSNYVNLKHLVMTGCDVQTRFVIPKKLMTITIDRNNLSFKDFYFMFSNSSNFLRIIDAWFNRININTRIPLFQTGMSLVTLGLHGNTMPIVYKETFRGLQNLRSLDIGQMDVKIIEDHAFDDLVQLRRLNVDKNEITSLPQNLFKPLGNLRSLDLTRCKLNSLPNLTGLPKFVTTVSLRHNQIEDISSIVTMGISSFAILLLGHNNITQLPTIVFQTIKARELDLSSNRLQNIEPFSFTACQNYLRFLILSHNQLTHVSSSAFKGLTDLASLFLFGNNISRIHPNAFDGMFIGDLFLYDNSITQMPAFLKNMRIPPSKVSKVLLYDNPLTQISNVTVPGMQIYLSCNKLQKIKDSTFNCAHTENFTFQLPSGSEWSETAEHSGYSCRKVDQTTLACKTCPRGTFMESGTCFECPPGSFYQDQLAQSNCKACPLGQYVPPEKAPGKNPLECVTCPEGTLTNQTAGFKACKCLNGFYRRYRFGNCVRCEAKGIQCEKDYQIVRPNYWWSWDYNRTCLKEYLAFVKNLERVNSWNEFVEDFEGKSEWYDRNSNTFRCQMPRVHKCVTKDICLGGILSNCQKGYTGPLCDLCLKGYYRHFKSCAKCPQLWIVCLQLLAYVILFILVCALINWADRLIVRLSYDEERSLADVILATLKILLGFYQVLSGTLMCFAYIPWPKTLHRALSVFKYIELELLRLPSLRCIDHNWEINAISDFWITLLSTILVPCIIYVYYFAKKCILRKTCRIRYEFLEKSNSCKKACLRATMIFLFSSYPVTSRRILQLLPFACDSICYDSGLKHCVSFLKAGYSLHCLSINSQRWLLYAVYASLLIPIGFPLLLLVYLFVIFRAKTEKVLYVSINADGCEGETPSPKDTQINNSMDKNMATHFATKFLYENYKSSCWFWEIVEMYRKLLLTSILPIFASQSKIILAVAIVLSGFFTVLHAYAKPIKDGFENHLQLISLSVIPANLCIGFMLGTMVNEGSETFEKTSEQLGTGVLLLVLNSLLIIALLARLVKIQIKKWRLLLSERRCSFWCCIACVMPCVTGRNTDFVSTSNY